MKKSLVALAAFAVVGGAYAQSSVTVSGYLKHGVASTNYSGGAVGAATGSGLSMADGSSRFAISGAEDLGGGLSADFQIETRLRTDENTGVVAGGNTWVGLRGNFGRVQLGKLDTHWFVGSDYVANLAISHNSSSTALTNAVTNRVGTAIADGIGGGRSVNLVRYTTPVFSGFTGQLNYSTNPGFTPALTPPTPGLVAGSEGTVGAAGEGRLMHAGLEYAQGPAKASLSVWNATSETRVAGATRSDQSAYTLFAVYDFGMASVGLTYNNSAVERGPVGGANNKTSRGVFSIPVMVPMGAGIFLFTYTKANAATLNIGTTTLTHIDSGATLLAVGYHHNLSKRTSLGVSYVKLDNQANANYALALYPSLNGTPNNTRGQAASQFYLGLRHAF